MSNPQNPLGRGGRILWLIAAGCFVLWLIVHILEQIWPWLLGGLILSAVLWLLVLRWRSRNRL